MKNSSIYATLLILWITLVCQSSVVANEPTLESASAESTSLKKPNVILIITDDQGYGDVGFHGNEMIQTPNLNRLAKESFRLSNFHVDPTCAETRSALMTGRYSTRTGVWHTIMGRSLLRKDEVTMADIFADSGYKTAMFGKWHLGDSYPFRPNDRGFQETLVHGGGGVGQTPDLWGNDYFDDTYLRNLTPEKQSGYCTDIWFSAAEKFIESNRKDPFFCYIATNAPHGPFFVDPKYSKAYEEKGVPQPMANFYGMITNIDENVGQLREKLEKWELENDTIVIFMTDNGTAAGVRRIPRNQNKNKKNKQKAKAQDSSTWKGFNAKMRGRKGSQYEGGHRVPCFVHWPVGGVLENKSSNQLTAHMDLLPTLIDLCGLKKPKVEFDGTSISSVLRGHGDDMPKRTLFVHSQRVDNPIKWKKSSVMTQQYRLVDGKELYDIQKDPSQTKNVAEANEKIVEGLKSEYEKWWASISGRFDEYCEIELGNEKANPTHFTCHDWHARSVPWNQVMIGRDPMANGVWAVNVAADGVYKITLRTRPGKDEKVLTATSAKVEVGDASAEKAVAKGSKNVALELKLKAGSAMLKTYLTNADGKSRGAYYVEVEKLD